MAILFQSHQTHLNLTLNPWSLWFLQVPISSSYQFSQSPQLIIASSIVFGIQVSISSPAAYQSLFKSTPWSTPPTSALSGRPLLERFPSSISLPRGSSFLSRFRWSIIKRRALQTWTSLSPHWIVFQAWGWVFRVSNQIKLFSIMLLLITFYILKL